MTASLFIKESLLEEDEDPMLRSRSRVVGKPLPGAGLVGMVHFAKAAADIGGIRFINKEQSFVLSL